MSPETWGHRAAWASLFRDHLWRGTKATCLLPPDPNRPRSPDCVPLARRLYLFPAELLSLMLGRALSQSSEALHSSESPEVGTPTPEEWAGDVDGSGWTLPLLGLPLRPPGCVGLTAWLCCSAMV